MLSIHSRSIQEDTLVALRIAKNGILQTGGILNVLISNNFLTSVKNAHSKYFADLQAKREAKIEEEKEKHHALNEVAEKVEESAKKDQIVIINRDIKVKKSGIGVAKEMIQEGNKQLQNCQAKRNINREQIQQAQSKIEMGLKRKMHLEKEMGDLQEKKKKTVK